MKVKDLIKALKLFDHMDLDVAVSVGGKDGSEVVSFLIDKERKKLILCDDTLVNNSNVEIEGYAFVSINVPELEIGVMKNTAIDGTMPDMEFWKNWLLETMYIMGSLF